MNGRFVGPVVEAGRGVRDVLAGQNDGLLHQQRLAVAAAVEELVARRDQPAGSILQALRVIMLFVDHADFQAGGTSENILGLGRILDAGQLDDDAIGALLLDDRFGDTQLVDPVAQCQDVLLQGGVLKLLQRHLGERQGKTGIVQLDGGHVAQILAQLLGAQGARLGITEFDDQTLAFPADAAQRHLGLAQHVAHVVGLAVQLLVERRLHVDLHEEMDAAAQIETEIHRQGADVRQPIGRCREQVQGDGIVFAQRLLQIVLGPQLGIGVRQLDLDAGRVGDDPLRRYLLLFERVLDPLQQGLIDLHHRIGRRYLNCRHLAEQVGQGIEQAQHQCGEDDEVFPPRIAVHPDPTFCRAACPGSNCLSP